MIPLYQQQPVYQADHPQPDNVAVMVSFSTTRPAIDKMVNILEGTSNNTAYPMEEEAIRTILYECLNEYLAFSLPKTLSPENCSFEFYLEDRFKALAGILNPPVTDINPYPDKRMMMFLNAQWAIACAELGRQLLPGIRDLNAHHQDVEQIQMFRVDDNKTGMYVLSGITYDQVDAESEEGL
ncbi:hypothetical protein [Pseudomonas phage D6]|nr:hypothetical protein [Pseudomonas phage D6]